MYVWLFTHILAKQQRRLVKEIIIININNPRRSKSRSFCYPNFPLKKNKMRNKININTKYIFHFHMFMYKYVCCISWIYVWQCHNFSIVLYLLKRKTRCGDSTHVMSFNRQLHLKWFIETISITNVFNSISSRPFIFHTLIKILSKQYQPLCLSQSNDVPYNIIICVTLI